VRLCVLGRGGCGRGGALGGGGCFGRRGGAAVALCPWGAAALVLRRARLGWVKLPTPQTPHPPKPPKPTPTQLPPPLTPPTAMWTPTCPRSTVWRRGGRAGRRSPGLERQSGPGAAVRAWSGSPGAHAAAVQEPRCSSPGAALRQSGSRAGGSPGLQLRRPEPKEARPLGAFQRQCAPAAPRPGGQNPSPPTLTHAATPPRFGGPKRRPFSERLARGGAAKGRFFLKTSFPCPREAGAGAPEMRAGGAGGGEGLAPPPPEPPLPRRPPQPRADRPAARAGGKGRPRPSPALRKGMHATKRFSPWHGGPAKFLPPRPPAQRRPLTFLFFFAHVSHVSQRVN
jgi:hypothetical protein